jgi:hypothetical protein
MEVLDRSRQPFTDGALERRRMPGVAIPRPVVCPFPPNARGATIGEIERRDMSKPNVWTVEIDFTEEGDSTRADAILETGSSRIHGWGKAQRNPDDDDVPRIGVEIAAARALEDVVRKLLGQAEDDIAEHTGEQAHVHP